MEICIRIKNINFGFTHIDPLQMTSHSQKEGRSLDNSCSLCVKTCAGPQHVAFCIMQGGAIDFLHTQKRGLRTMRVILGVNSLLCMFV